MAPKGEEDVGARCPISDTDCGAARETAAGAAAAAPEGGCCEAPADGRPTLARRPEPCKPWVAEKERRRAGASPMACMLLISRLG
jgi:hypothetical protein